MNDRVLIVEDEEELCRLLELELQGRGFTVSWATTVDAALPRVLSESFDVVLTDLNLPKKSGLELCTSIASARSEVPVVVMTAFGSLDTAIAAIRAGAYDFVVKPLDMDALEVALRRAAEHRSLRAEVRQLRAAFTEAGQLDDLIGQSEPMRRLFELVSRVAVSDASVLIHGESGSGKEGVARALHRRSRRAAGPFVALNCAAVPDSLLESELFGHVKGAFTDARADKPGLFLEANGGSLFLDEISDLSPTLQPKLLRALQERSVRAVGGAHERPFDVRLIAATHRDLDEEVKAGRFRSDLLYRIQVVHLAVPPLRERGNDIVLLAEHFLEQFARRAGQTVPALSNEAAERLRDYPWPGNVRELQNCMERAIALLTGRVVAPDDLPERIREFRGVPSIPTPVAEAELLPLDELERRHILRALDILGGNKTQAARVLGLDRRTLYRKLAQYGVLAEDGTD